MYGNGVKIGIIAVITVTVLQPTLQDHHLALTAWTVAAAGASARSSAEFRFVTTTPLTTALTISGCAFLYLRINT